MTGLLCLRAETHRGDRRPGCCAERDKPTFHLKKKSLILLEVGREEQAALLSFARERSREPLRTYTELPWESWAPGMMQRSGAKGPFGDSQPQAQCAVPNNNTGERARRPPGLET